MHLIPFLIVLFLIGLFVGAVARLLLPGPDPMSLGMTALIGVAGSLIAGLFSWYVLHRHGAGFVLSVIFSMILVALYRRTYGGGFARGGGRYGRGGSRYARGGGLRRW